MHEDEVDELEDEVSLLVVQEHDVHEEQLLLVYDETDEIDDSELDDIELDEDEDEDDIDIGVEVIDEMHEHDAVADEIDEIDEIDICVNDEIDEIDEQLLTVVEYDEIDEIVIIEIDEIDERVNIDQMVLEVSDEILYIEMVEHDEPE